ncbi:MAG: type II toxin-antitoxin system RatA family toxin [Magnetococcales bacterium]|nr:type II toxin-antitoxin system RatA family toxin [Magnetococcales bacterium]MBF0322315.1 type II toxin-antitoxin system RatA family toxin [Magnetococcales bacterium]
MSQHQVNAIVPYTPQQMYDLVVDMDSYPQFLPWCVQARKYDVTETQFMAEMTISFKGLRETFRTVDLLVPGRSIRISLHSGPFKRLENFWNFTPVSGGTRVEFSIDFKFKNRLLDVSMGPLFSMVTQRMVAAFRQRADIVYGSSPT